MSQVRNPKQPQPQGQSFFESKWISTGVLLPTSSLPKRRWATLLGPDQAQPEDPFSPSAGLLRRRRDPFLSIPFARTSFLLCSSMKCVVESTFMFSILTSHLPFLAEQIPSLSHLPVMISSAQPNHPKQSTSDASCPSFTQPSIVVWWWIWALVDP